MMAETADIDFVKTLDLSEVSDGAARTFQIEETMQVLRYCLESVPGFYDAHCRKVFRNWPGVSKKQRYLVGLLDALQRHILNSDDDRRVADDQFHRFVDAMVTLSTKKHG